jgi:DNA-binding NarL/FixJ family response regulator
VIWSPPWNSWLAYPPPTALFVAWNSIAIRTLSRPDRQPIRARSHLRAAAEAFARLGCQAWEERSRVELRAAGESTSEPARDHFAELTPQELQIVRLVSEGLSNRQVAEQLFLSPRTVEYHLYKVYPKLGIGSRTDLIRRWTDLERASVPAG